MEENEQVMSDEIREEVEWCNIRWFDGADTGKRVLLIGDRSHLAMQCGLREAKGKANSYGMALHIKEHRQPFTSKGNRVCDERVSGGTDSF